MNKTEEWAFRDQEVRAELRTEVQTSTQGAESKYGFVAVYRGTDRVGTASFYRTSIEWLLQTDRLRVEEPFRFQKSLHESGQQQFHFGFYVVNELFRAFPDKEIRESPAINNPSGNPFVERLRGVYMLPYHYNQCFPIDSAGLGLAGGCSCPIGGRFRSLPG